jgi:hypothetical protein
MITKKDAKEELKNSLSTFEIAIPAFNLAVLALLYQLDISTESLSIQYLYNVTLILTLAGILLLPFYSLRNWAQSRLKMYAFNKAEKYKDELLDMAEQNDTSSELDDFMSTRDKWLNKLHLLIVKLLTGLIRIIVPVFFLNIISFAVLTYFLKM